MVFLASLALPFEVPAWAFPINPAPATTVVGQSVAPDTALLHVPDSLAAFTRAQVKDFFAAPDWHAEDHPPMPEIVAHGRRPLVYACAYCHLPNGHGRPENATLAGLPAQYIVQQVKDMASHVRHSAWVADGYLPGKLMPQVAENASEAEIAEAATYFSGIAVRRPRAQVIETDRVAKSHVAGWMYVASDGAGDEPLGERIIEMPRDFERHELRDSAVEYVAYVPRGSVERGRVIAKTGAGGLAPPCESCHGPGLRGVGPIPPIAGRSPTYLLRQLLAFRSGARAAPASQPMQSVVSRLELNDMIAVAAYAGTQAP
jgi:cytochrome c553